MLCCGQSVFINYNVRQQKVFRCLVVANQRLVFSSDTSVDRRDNENFIFGIDSQKANMSKGKKLSEFNGTRKTDRIQWNTKYFSKPAEK